VPYETYLKLILRAIIVMGIMFGAVMAVTVFLLPGNIDIIY